MESEFKNAFDGSQGVGSSEGKNRRTILCSLILRLVALAMSLVAVIVMATAKETQTVNIVVVPTLPAMPITATAKSSYSSAFVYFVVANAIACGYSALSLVMLITNRAALLITILDLLVLALLFSGVGAAAAIGVVGERGISHVGWNKVCNVYAKFCGHAMASVAISLLGSLAYVMLLLLAIVGLHKG